MPEDEQPGGAPPAMVSVPQPEPRCGFDPNAGIGAGSTIVQAAGLGNLAAMRLLLNVSIDAALAKGNDEPHAIVAAAEALTFARLCAAHRVPMDVRTLAGALCLTSDRTRHLGLNDAADNLLGESVAILEQLADEGDEIAALASGQLVAAHPATAEIAKLVLSGTEK